MQRKIAFGLLWLGFSLYAFFLAPPDQPDTFELIGAMASGNFDGINPTIICLFNLMGVWPLIYTCVLLADGRDQKVPAWPFLAGSMALGAFALIPYFVFRQPNQTFTGKKSWLINRFDSRFTGIVLTITATILFTIAIIQGDWFDYVTQFQTSRFIHVMSLDFCVLSLLFPAILGDDMARRGWQTSAVFWSVSLVPLFGPLIYLCIRPPLPESTDSPAETEPQATPLNA
ncbi:MAG: DUF2834 domain-containing protein [Cyanobacteria bacterium P01_H01_bin.15]